MPKVLIQFTLTMDATKSLFNLRSFCTIKNVENCPLFKAKQKLFRKKNPIVSLVVKTRNYYREGIRYPVNVNCKVYPNIFENSQPMDQKWWLLQIFLYKCWEKSYRINIPIIACLGCLSGTVYFTYFYLIRAFISMPVEMIRHTPTKEADQLWISRYLWVPMPSANPARYSLY